MSEQSRASLSALYFFFFRAVLRALPEDIELDEIDRIRAYYDDHVDSLAHRNLISLDDASVYKEIYPLFDPFFVSYSDDGQSLEQIAQGILGL
jgi:hypothetical protein